MSVKIITEIASTHNGNVKLLEDLTNDHLKTKSDYIKYQIFKAKNLVNIKDKNFKKFKKIEISYNNWSRIIKKFKKKLKLLSKYLILKAMNSVKNLKMILT